MTTQHTSLLGTTVAFLIAVGPAAAQTGPLALSDHFTGDIGLGGFVSSEVAQGQGRKTSALPYVYGDWGRAFARIDTFGVKTLPVGEGYLELVARYSTEGYDTDTAALRGLNNRRTPRPIGLGTFQRFDWGGVFVYAMRDLRSGGALLEATWAGRFNAGPVALYPQLGVEYRSSAYVNALYGVTPAEAAAGGFRVYTAGAATQPRVAIAASLPLGGDWSLQAQLRHTWLASAVRNSPVVSARTLDTGYLAVTYEFK